MKITRQINAKPNKNVTRDPSDLLDKDGLIGSKIAEINGNILIPTLAKDTLINRLNALKSLDDNTFDEEYQSLSNKIVHLSTVLSDPDNSITGVDKNGEFKIENSQDIAKELQAKLDEEAKLEKELKEKEEADKLAKLEDEAKEARELREKEDAEKKAKLDELKAEKEKLFGVVQDKVQLGLDFAGQVAMGQVQPNFFEKLFESLFESFMKGVLSLPKQLVKGFWHLNKIKDNPNFQNLLEAHKSGASPEELKSFEAKFLEDPEVKDQLKLGQGEVEDVDFDSVDEPMKALDEHTKSDADSEFSDVGKIIDWDTAYKYGYAKLKQIHGANYDAAKAKATLDGLKAKYPDNPQVVIGALKYGGRRRREDTELNSRVSELFHILRDEFKDYNVSFDVDEGQIEMNKGVKRFIVTSGNEKLMLLESESLKYATSEYSKFLNELKRQLNCKIMYKNQKFSVTRIVNTDSGPRKVTTNIDALDELEAEDKVKLLDSRRQRNTRDYNSIRQSNAWVPFSEELTDKLDAIKNDIEYKNSAGSWVPAKKVMVFGDDRDPQFVVDTDSSTLYLKKSSMMKLLDGVETSCDGVKLRKKTK